MMNPDGAKKVAPPKYLQCWKEKEDEEEEDWHCDDGEGGPGTSAYPAFKRFNTLHPGVDKDSLTKPQTKKPFQKGLLPSAQGSLLLGSPAQSLMSTMLKVLTSPPKRNLLGPPDPNGSGAQSSRCNFQHHIVHDKCVRHWAVC